MRSFATWRLTRSSHLINVMLLIMWSNHQTIQPSGIVVAVFALCRRWKQVVRQMKEELCYVAFNPATEEKVTQPDTVYKLPDGQTIRVRTPGPRPPSLLPRKFQTPRKRVRTIPSPTARHLIPPQRIQFHDTHPPTDAIGARIVKWCHPIPTSTHRIPCHSVSPIHPLLPSLHPLFSW